MNLILYCPICGVEEGLIGDGENQRSHRVVCEPCKNELSFCPVYLCKFIHKEADEVAIHMISHHGWDEEAARLWLRDEVERKG